MGDISEVITKGTTAKKFLNDGVAFIKIESINSRTTLGNKLSYISEEEHKTYLKRSILKEGDILFSIAGALGIVHIVQKEELPANTNQALSIIRLKQKEKIEYVSWFLETPSIKKMILELKSIGAQPNLSLEQISNIKIPMLSSNKLEHIVVELLNTIEKRIETQNKIIEELQSLRKAIYYEQIKGAKKEEMMISDICDIGRGRVISQQEIAKQNNPIYPVFSSQTLNNGIMGYLDNYDFDGEYITWTTDGANAGTIFYHNGKFNCTNVCGTLKTNSEKVIPYYLFLALSHEAKRYVSTNLGNPKLMNGTMAKIKIKVPSIVVQKTVVNGSMILDRLIDIETKILNALSSQKSYFLANLFI
ncbi:MAG: restriction endonuclease subunit S [Bacilli bacterium]|nr:restriction endonuclease subunit S [Bacilli bacterium]